MTQIRPFCGLRPVPEYAAEIAALPYDVMDTEEARQILNKNPLSFLRVTKSEAIRTARQFIRWRKQISTGICPTGR